MGVDDLPCSKCGEEPRVAGQRWGLSCFAAYKREKRPKHSELSVEEKRRANARAYANTYLGRGKIKREPCKDCGGPGEHMHHEDYDKPLEVTWLCKDCHKARHRDD